MRSRAARLMGREDDLARLLRLLAPDGPRLVTLTGPGGVGKTSLAREVVALLAERAADVRFADVRFVPLEHAHRADELARALADLPPAPPEGERLVILDNLEQLLPAALPFVRAAASTPGARVLVTSRIVLRLVSEHVVTVAPLDVPLQDDEASVLGSPAARLLLSTLERRHARYAATLRSSSAGLASVARLVRRLEGLPLALELAASSLRAQTVESLEARLDGGAPLESGLDFTERHRNLDRAARWSYDLLPEGQHVWLRHLGALRSPWTLTRAERFGRLVGLEGNLAEIVADLVDASLLTVEFEGGGSEARYRMMEPLRRVAQEELRQFGEFDFARQMSVQVEG